MGLRFIFNWLMYCGREKLCISEGPVITVDAVITAVARNVTTVHTQSPTLSDTLQSERTRRAHCAVLDTLSRYVKRRLVCFTRVCLVNELSCYLGIAMTLHLLLSDAQPTSHKYQPPMFHCKYCSLLLNETSGLGWLVGKERTWL